MKTSLVALVLALSSFGFIDEFKSESSLLSDEYSYCDSLKRLSRNKVFELSKISPAEHDRYLACKYFKKNKRTDFISRCKFKKGRYEIRGLKSYGGVLSPIKLPFRYDIYQDDGISVIEVRIYFKDRDVLKKPIENKLIPEETYGYYAPLNNYSQMMDFYLLKASEFWSEFSPNQNIKFRFKQVHSKKQAHFKVGLKEKNGGILYNYNWNIHMRQVRGRTSKRLIDRTVAHEIGHMLGLEDEYSRFWGILSGKYFSMFHNHFKKDCTVNSLMCTPVIMWTTQEPISQDYHYYQIFNRVRKC